MTRLQHVDEDGDNVSEAKGSEPGNSWFGSICSRWGDIAAKVADACNDDFDVLSVESDASFDDYDSELEDLDDAFEDEEDEAFEDFDKSFVDPDFSSKRAKLTIVYQVLKLWGLHLLDKSPPLTTKDEKRSKKRSRELDSLAN